MSEVEEKMADNLKKIDILSNLLYCYFRMQIPMTKFKHVNYPTQSPCIFAICHAYQMSFYGVKNRNNLNILISASNDGEIIARGVERVGINVVRGSQGRGGTQATFKLLEKIEMGQSIGITVDGPKGPKFVVKKGIINIAKLSQVPIIPMVWNSDAWNFFKLKTWDGLSFPIWFIKTLLLCGEPIYVPADIEDNDVEIYRQRLETELLELDKRAKTDFKEFMKEVSK